MKAFALRRLAPPRATMLCLLTAGLGAFAADPTSGLVARLALMSDLHVTRGTNEDQPLHPMRLARTIADINRAGVDLVLVAGDLTEFGTAEEARDFHRQMRALQPPFWYVPGNHDVGNKPLKGAKSPVSFKRIVDYHLRFGPSWFDREAAGVRVIGVNSGLLGTGLPQENRQWAFLEKALAAPVTNKPTLLMLHHPPFVKSVDEPGGDYFNLEPYPRARLLALARQGGVRAVFSGHTHKPLTNHYGNILLYTTPPVAFGLPRDKGARGWTLVTVTTNRIRLDFQPVADPPTNRPPERQKAKRRRPKEAGTGWKVVQALSIQP